MKVEGLHVILWGDVGIFGTMQIAAAGRRFTAYCLVLVAGAAGCQRSAVGCLRAPKGSCKAFQHLAPLFF